MKNYPLLFSEGTSACGGGTILVIIMESHQTLQHDEFQSI
jgi:hypothetical protein